MNFNKAHQESRMKDSYLKTFPSEGGGIVKGLDKS